MRELGLVIASVLFGALVSHFITSVSEKKTVNEQISEALKSQIESISKLVSKEIQNHCDLYHQQRTQILIKEAIADYDKSVSKTMDDNATTHEQIFEKVALVENMVNEVRLQIAEIMTLIKMRGLDKAA